MRSTLTAIAMVASCATGVMTSAAMANDERPQEMIGHHLRVNYGNVHNLMKCPIREVCPGYDFVDEGTGYTILGFADTDTFMSKTAIKVKLDDGRVGYFEEFDLLSRYNTLQGEEKAQDRCRKLPSIRIGATPAEVRQSKWGDPYDRHTTETAAHVREQWVYKFGPSCKENGLPNRNDDTKYLYFEDERLVTIQK